MPKSTSENISLDTHEDTTADQAKPCEIMTAGQEEFVVECDEDTAPADEDTVAVSVLAQVAKHVTNPDAGSEFLYFNRLSIVTIMHQLAIGTD